MANDSRIRRTTATLAVAATLIGGFGTQGAYAEDTTPTTPSTGTEQPGEQQPAAPAAWKAVPSGSQTGIDLKEEADGTLTGTFDETADPSDEITVTGYGADGVALPDTTFTVKGEDKGATLTDGGKLGVGEITGTTAYTADKTDTHPAVNATMGYRRTVGAETGIDTGATPIAFTKGEDGTWSADDANYTLDTKNQPDGDTVKLTDGTTATITWGKDTTVVEKDNGADGKTRFVRRTGKATGEITVKDGKTGRTLTQKYEVNTTADRAEDTSITKLTITRTDADGKTSTAYEGAFDPADTNLTIDPLPADQIGDAFTIGFATGADAKIETHGMTLGADASRVFKFTANGKDYTVTVPFKTAQINDIKADSPAKLTGIYVNRSGESTQGDLIANWDPNRLDYIIQLGENDPNPYVLPVAGDDVTVQAGDRTQNAQGTRQEWKVTAKTGETRVYSVTTVRPVKTAVTEFKPNDPVAQPSTVAPDDEKDANLASHGYVDKDGAYHKTDADRYTIPEGGSFSYEAKNGQSVSVSSTRTGMTVTYTVTVLPQDTSAAPKRFTYTTTYITKDTAKAELSGITVNGENVNGFDPAKHAYSVAVVNPDQWTVAPVYDKTTGMSVTTHKDGRKATITVTSGDGLTKTTYTVEVTQKMKLIDTVTATLAETGAKGGLIGLGAVILLAVLGGGAWLVNRKRRDGDTTSDDTTRDAPAAPAEQ